LVVAEKMKFLRLIWRIARQIFHEATGALFFFFSFYGAVGVWRNWQHRAGLWLVALAAIYAVIMFVFGVSCFRSAGRVR
jgi:hypothetical protein